MRVIALVPGRAELKACVPQSSKQKKRTPSMLSLALCSNISRASHQCSMWFYCYYYFIFLLHCHFVKVCVPAASAVRGAFTHCPTTWRPLTLAVDRFFTCLFFFSNPASSRKRGKTNQEKHLHLCHFSLDSAQTPLQNQTEHNVLLLVRSLSVSFINHQTRWNKQPRPHVAFADSIFQPRWYLIIRI